MTRTLTRDWTLHPTPVFQVKSRCLEDFTVTAEDAGDYTALYVAGDSTLQDQRLHVAESRHPLGPFADCGYSWGLRHTRLSRGRGLGRSLVAAVWPGLPNSGLWLYTPTIGGTYQAEIVVPPEHPYNVEASNPTILENDDGTVDFVFEGRGKQVDWRLYQGRIHADGRVTVDKTEICPGANPSLFRDGNRVYLYHSRRAHGLPGFDTWAFYQDL